MSLSGYDWPAIQDAIAKTTPFRRGVIRSIFLPDGVRGARQVHWSDLDKEGQDVIVLLLGLPPKH